MPPSRPRRRLLGAVLSLASLALLAGQPGRAVAQSAPSRTPLKIGVIGTGRIGGALAEHWAKAGHELVISSRHPEELKPLAERLGPKVRAGTPAQAAAFGEVVLMAVPYGALPEIGRDHTAALAGKVVIDTGNPQASRDGAMADAARAKGSGVASSEYLPGVRLVRAFTSVPAGALRDTDQGQGKNPGERLGVPLAGDDAQALQLAARLVRDAGCEPVVVGGLARAHDFDIGTPVFGRALTADALRQQLGVGR